MELAKQMLDVSQHSLKEIAHQCGFNGPTGFSRKFRQEFGSSPSEYRKNVLGEGSEKWSWKIPFDENDLEQLIKQVNKNTWLTKLLVIIISNLDNESLDIKELSGTLFMSSSNLNRKVQGLFGFSVMRLVRDLRLQHAGELISVQNKSVTETAALAGFFDAAHLSRYFKQTFGCSPGEYRNVQYFFSYINKLRELLMIQTDK